MGRLLSDAFALSEIRDNVLKRTARERWPRRFRADLQDYSVMSSIDRDLWDKSDLSLLNGIPEDLSTVSPQPGRRSLYPLFPGNQPLPWLHNKCILFAREALCALSFSQAHYCRVISPIGIELLHVLELVLLDGVLSRWSLWWSFWLCGRRLLACHVAFGHS